MPSKVRKRGGNSWELTVSDGRNAAGQQILYRKTIQADNITEAKEQYNVFLSEVLQGKVLVAGTERMTLTDFYDYWKEKHANKRYAKTTLACYEQMFVRIKVSLGHLRIDKIKPVQLVDFFAQLAKPEAKNDNTPLAERSINKHRELIQLLFSSALKWELILSNPISKLDKPRTEHKRKLMPTQEEVIQFFDCLNSAPIRNQLMCMLAFTGGMRREEFSALKWGDFNIEKHTVKIQRAATYIPGDKINIGTTKTSNSERTLSLPASVIYLLEQYKAEIKAKAARKAKRKKVVSIDDPTKEDKWLFAKPDGSIGHPHAANSFLRKFCDENKLFHFTPHLLRHLHGSYLLRNGLDISAVSKNLGHSKKSFTLDTYIHTIDSIENETASIMQDVLNDLKLQKQKKGQAK